ncbi:MBL fold metallo-hydrolase [Aeropyrum camini]|uniref:MBL fold metallo-hydrolase n=1 Tax=Aeropyrum camini TaxID=229980 RepID=UPI000789A443|nr:MBL fold metallo-hydrolase [Aeropyrum camini]
MPRHTPGQHLRSRRPGECLVIDPGGAEVLDLLSRLGCRDVVVAITHGHFDHVAAVEPLVARGAVVAAHPLAPRVAEAYAELGVKMGYLTATPRFGVDIELSEGKTLEAAGLSLRILYTPGHSPDHIVLHEPRLRLAFTGDLIFMGSIGRVDIALGDPAAMERSLARIARELPPETRLLPGHGPETTLGRELLHNPYLQRLSP